MSEEENRKYIFAQLRSLPNAFQYVAVTNYIEDLEKENKKYKEVIDKATDRLKYIIDYLEKKDMFHNFERELLYILKGDNND